MIVKRGPQCVQFEEGVTEAAVVRIPKLCQAGVAGRDVGRDRRPASDGRAAGLDVERRFPHWRPFLRCHLVDHGQWRRLVPQRGDEAGHRGVRPLHVAHTLHHTPNHQLHAPPVARQA
jgi:hypothetical protein